MNTKAVSERSVVVLLAGIMAVVAGALTVGSQVDAFDPSTAVMMVGWGLIAIGGICVQAAAVGLLLTAGASHNDHQQAAS